MADVFTKEKRSLIMSKIAGKDTKPEILVRKMVHGMGFRFRLHVKRLSGRPDLVLAKHKKVIFVHGCFWHGHPGCKRSKRPSTNRKFWNEKIDKNIERDKRAIAELKKEGWDVLVVWECQTKDLDGLAETLTSYLDNERPYG